MFYDNLKGICDSKGLKITPIVAECGGAKGSISNWKKGAIPNSEIVIRLAQRLEVSTDVLLLGSDKWVFSKEQEELLSHFNRLSLVDKGKVIERAKILAEFAAEKETKNQAAEQTQKTVEIPVPAADEQPEPEDDEPEQDEEFFIDLCSLPASAGSGVQLDDGFTEPMQIKHTMIAERANYAVRVSGNSMEDKYYDGDIVLIETCPDIEIGEIGIFIVNDQGYIKQRGEDRLISLNPEYDDIFIHEGDVVYCRGRVLGKAEVIE